MIRGFLRALDVCYRLLTTRLSIVDCYRGFSSMMYDAFGSASTGDDEGIRIRIGFEAMLDPAEECFFLF